MAFSNKKDKKRVGTVDLKKRFGQNDSDSNEEYRYENGRQVLYSRQYEEPLPPPVNAGYMPEYPNEPRPLDSADTVSPMNQPPFGIEQNGALDDASKFANAKDKAGQIEENEIAEPKDLFELANIIEEKNARKQKEENEVVIRVRDKVKEHYSTKILSERENPEFKAELFAWITDALKDEGRYISADRRERVAKRITNLIVGLGPLEDLLSRGYTEIMVSRYDKIYVEEKGGMVLSDAAFGSEEELQTLIYQIAGTIGRTINSSEPICDGWLKDGSRFNAVVPPIAADGATLTIRRFSDKKLTGEDYLKFGSLNEDILTFFDFAVRGGLNLICSGGTGSGKTSLLNLMSNFLSYDPGLSVVTIEDSLELKINHPNVRREETRKSNSKDGSGEITAQLLVKNALRQRPDRIIIGEIRDGTIADFLRAAGSGHDGCMTTIHANSPQELESQIVVLFMMAKDYDLDPDTIRMMYSNAVDIVIQIKRYSDHVRRISQISHIVGYGLQACNELGIGPGNPEYSDKKVYVRDIFRFVKTGVAEDGKFIGDYLPTGYIPKALLEKGEMNGASIDLSIFKPKKSEKSEDINVNDGHSESVEHV